MICEFKCPTANFIRSLYPYVKRCIMYPTTLSRNILLFLVPIILLRTKWSSHVSGTMGKTLKTDAHRANFSFIRQTCRNIQVLYNFSPNPTLFTFLSPFTQNPTGRLASLWAGTKVSNRPIGGRESGDGHFGVQRLRTSCHGAPKLKLSVSANGRGGRQRTEPGEPFLLPPILDSITPFAQTVGVFGGLFGARLVH